MSVGERYGCGQHVQTLQLGTGDIRSLEMAYLPGGVTTGRGNPAQLHLPQQSTEIDDLVSVDFPTLKHPSMATLQLSQSDSLTTRHHPMPAKKPICSNHRILGSSSSERPCSLGILLLTRTSSDALPPTPFAVRHALADSCVSGSVSGLKFQGPTCTTGGWLGEKIPRPR